MKESAASSPDVHLVCAEAQQGVQHQTGGQVIGLAQLLYTHSSAPVHGLPPSACCRHRKVGGGGRLGHHTDPGQPGHITYRQRWRTPDWPRWHFTVPGGNWTHWGLLIQTSGNSVNIVPLVTICCLVLVH